MLSIATAIFLTLMGSAIYHLIPQGSLRTRMGWVAALSFMIVFAYYPVAALFAFGAGVLTWLLALLGMRHKNLQKYAPFTLIGILLLFGFEDFYISTNVYSETLVQFGMSFYLLRLYLSLRTVTAKGQAVRLEEFLVIALFFPIFPAGPICAQEAFSRSSFMGRPLWQNYLMGFMRIGIGIFALYFVTGAIDAVARPITPRVGYVINWPAIDPFTTYQIMLLTFMDMYANFAGYTQIAIGLGLFFGFEIPENFRYPFLATNIQNFWQRWHLSLSRFITNQIYLPLMLTLRKPRLSMLLAFVMVGMWHKISVQYLVWGLGHGSMLVAYMTLSGSQLHATIVARIHPRLWTALSWLLTISLVAFFSTFANQPNLAMALAFARSLFAG